MPCRCVAGGIDLFVRVTPNARLDRIEGFETRDDGTEILHIRVRAVPDRGKANAAVIALLAKSLGLPKSTVRLKSGETARLKTLFLPGDAHELAQAIAKLVEKPV